MAVSIVATAGSASANSFVTLAEANTYVEGRLNASTWETDATDDDKNRALVEATRELNALPWDSLRTDDTQALAWPRQSFLNPDSPNAQYFDTDEIPQRVKNATMELAFQFVKAGTTDIASLDPTDGIIRKKIDVLETEYAPAAERRIHGLRRFPRIWNEVGCLLTVQPGAVPVVRG